MKQIERVKKLCQQPDPLLLTALGLCLLYLFWAAIIPHGYFETVDEGGKALYIQNTIRTGNPAAPFIYPGRSLDPQGLFFPTWWRLQRGDEFYTWWQPGFPLLTLPFYSLLGWFGLFLVPAVSGGAIAYLSGALLRQLAPVSDRVAVLCALCVGLASPVMYYSANFHEHTLATALLLASLLLALRSRQNNHSALSIISGALASLAVFFRTETVTILFGVGLVLLISDWRSGLRFGLAFVGIAVAWMSVNYLITGYPINHHINVLVDQEGGGTAARIGIKLVPAVLFGQGGIGALKPTRNFLLVTSLFSLIGLGLLFFKRTRIIASLCFLAAGAACCWILFSPVGYRTIHGLVEIAPQLLFASMLFTVGRLWKKSLFPWMLLVGGVVFMAAYYLKAWSAAGGIQWGPRYMLSLFPLLIVSAFGSLFIHWTEWKPVSRLVVGGSFLVCSLVGVGFEIRGWYTNYTMLSLYRQSEPTLREMKDTLVVSAYCDPPLHIPDLYWQQVFMSTSRSGEEVWSDAVNKGEISSYYRLDSWDVCSADPFTKIREDRLFNPTGLVVTKTTK